MERVLRRHADKQHGSLHSHVLPNMADPQNIRHMNPRKTDYRHDSVHQVIPNYDVAVRYGKQLVFHHFMDALSRHFSACIPREVLLAQADEQPHLVDEWLEQQNRSADEQLHYQGLQVPEHAKVILCCVDDLHH